MRRIAFEELKARIERVLVGLGMEPERAALGARLTAEADRDGVKTHGVARLPRFAEMVRIGSVDVKAKPECVARFGALERWDGHLGPGNVAAYAAMERACELAAEFGVGCVGLGNTTHWMRAGSYGWQAANRGMAAMCWTNTMANLPPWGAKTPAVGNNPLVMAVPRVDGAHVVVDLAMSQFSYGTLTAYRQAGELLPVPGGYDESGELTRDPGAIEQTQRALPVGFWKGSGLSFVLDVMGAMLSGGRTTAEITPDPLREVGMSQVFLAMSPGSVVAAEEMERAVRSAVDAVHDAEPVVAGRPARYPGEGTLRVREQSLREGVAVTEPAWEGFVRLEAAVVREEYPRG